MFNVFFETFDYIVAVDLLHMYSLVVDKKNYFCTLVMPNVVHDQLCYTCNNTHMVILGVLHVLQINV